jgi:hypothetical protein
MNQIRARKDLFIGYTEGVIQGAWLLSRFNYETREPDFKLHLSNAINLIPLQYLIDKPFKK